LRYTPAGIPVLEMWLKHQSRQQQAGLERDVSCEIQAVLIGHDASRWAGKLAGHSIEVSGFLTQRSLRNPRLVLHIEHVELIKG
jgi:primosomal replication protein N